MRKLLDNDEIVKINQGITFSGNFFWVGVEGIVLAMFLLVKEIHFAIPPVIVFISIPLILSIKIIEIDQKNNIF